jgi:hypothetical protein
MCLVMVLGNSIDFCSDDALGISAEPVFVCVCVCMCASVCVCVRVCIVLVPLFGWTMNAVVNYVHQHVNSLLMQLLHSMMFSTNACTRILLWTSV